MEKTSFDATWSSLYTALCELYSKADRQQQAMLCRTLDGFLLPRVDRLMYGGDVPKREPLAVTLGIPSPGQSQSVYCIACGVHHGQPELCPHHTARS